MTPATGSASRCSGRVRCLGVSMDVDRCKRRAACACAEAVSRCEHRSGVPLQQLGHARAGYPRSAVSFMGKSKIVVSKPSSHLINNK